MSEAVTQEKPNRIPTPEELGFDPAVLRAKYAAERQKRLRADGNDQYREVTGALEHYNHDPYVEPGFTRPALQEELDAVIIGGGFGGLLAAARLQEVGIADIRIIEKAGISRDLVLEPLSRRTVRHRILRLSAAPGRDRAYAEGEVLLRAGDFRARPADRKALQPL
jgi:NADPH-dependent 2,4-dienoyl-CoA reductase/sulfur reductase-like enzyme